METVDYAIEEAENLKIEPGGEHSCNEALYQLAWKNGGDTCHFSQLNRT